MIPFCRKTNTTTTTAATKTPSPSQKHQQIQARFILFLCWASSHESLFEGSAETLVQNLKREGGRPELRQLQVLAREESTARSTGCWVADRTRRAEIHSNASSSLRLCTQERATLG